ncbi:MAG: AraC family transcriptional regulator [Eubacteriales bacterium]|nr:AraC family transcriptional regulator [Eubacteriales bacterium]
METITEITDIYGNVVFKLFKSTAYARKNQVRMHRHTLFEISLIIKGNGNYLTEHGLENINQGDVFIFSGNEYHCIKDIEPCEDGKDMELLNIQFNSSFVLKDSESYTENFMDVFFKRKAGFSNKIGSSAESEKKLINNILLIKKECEDKLPCYHYAVKADLIRLLVVLYRDFNLTDANCEIRCGVKHTDEINKAVAFINAHYCENITLKEIVSVSTVSKSTFIAAFYQQYNMTTWDYINIKRIEKALSLLKNTDKTILCVATECGYNNTANFNRIFKKITGITPKVYRSAK